ncbi:MAG TPA: DUF4260 domain-containing protein [Actinomycetota bacterium]
MTQPEAPSVVGLPRVLLRLEGLIVLALAILLYAKVGRSWWLFAILLLAPDLGMLGYVRGTRVGAVAYNAFHTYVAAGTLALVGVIAEHELTIALALIWFAHIGFDRALGYGLKYPEGFGSTHLGRIGRRG